MTPSTNGPVRVDEAWSGTPPDPNNNVLAATGYFTEDAYTVPAAFEKELHGVFAVDFNHDGFPDLLAPQHEFPPNGAPFVPARIVAFTNDRTGHFVETTDQVLGDVRATCPNAHIVADFNGDGWDDVFIADMGNDVEPWGQGKKFFLFIQKANGTLVDEASFRMPPVWAGIPHKSSAGDIDGDGDLDIVVTSTGGEDYRLLVNTGQGYFQYETERLPVAKPNWIPNNCQMLDVNKDGYADIFMGEEGAHYPQDFIFMNDGTGHFAYAPDNALPLRVLGAGSGTGEASSADLNGDGWLDLVLSNVAYPNVRVQILFNMGNGTFADVSDRVSGPSLNIQPAGTSSLPNADGNGDGWPDLLAGWNVWGGSYYPHLLINHAGMQFEDVTNTVWNFHPIVGEPPVFEFTDVEADGDMDVIGIFPGSDQVYVLVNQTPYPIPEAALPYPGTPVLLTPSNAELVPGTQATLTWDVVPSAYSYRIQIAEDSGFGQMKSDRRVTTNSFQMMDMIGNSTYYWRVQAFNTRGAGDWSPVHYFIAALPVYPPTNAQLQRLTIDYGFFKVYTNRLTWQANPETPAVVINYRIYRIPKDATDGAWPLLAELPAATVTYDDRGLRNDQLFTYRITAFSSQGIESEPATIGN